MNSLKDCVENESPRKTPELVKPIPSEYPLIICTMGVYLGL